MRARTEFESHQRKLVNGSDPASEANWQIAFKERFSFVAPFNAFEQVESEPSTNFRWWDWANHERTCL
jgi:hypothetical protein